MTVGLTGAASGTAAATLTSAIFGIAGGVVGLVQQLSAGIQNRQLSGLPSLHQDPHPRLHIPDLAQL